MREPVQRVPTKATAGSLIERLGFSGVDPGGAVRGQPAGAAPLCLVIVKAQDARS